MIKILINNKTTEVPQGSTILDAAQKLGIEIPTMCYLKELKPSTSCMVCVVEDKNSGKIFPACTALAVEGMDIETDNDEIVSLRISALELLLSDHLGDCEAPCQRVCPAHMNIPLMNRLIEKKQFAQAVKIVKETIPLPGMLGYICPAPCEKACRRKDIDQPVSICLLKRFVALTDLGSNSVYYPVQKEKTNKKVAVIGSGPAGLSAAYYILQEGHDCHIFDKNEKSGGKLRYEISEEHLPQQVLNDEINILENMGAQFELNRLVDKHFFDSQLISKFDAVIISTNSEVKISEFVANQNNLSKFHDMQIFEIHRTFVILTTEKPIKMAVRAVHRGRLLALSVNQYFNHELVSGIRKPFNSTFGKLVQTEFQEYLKESNNLNEKLIPKDPRIGFSIEEATEEARRCMHCDCRKPDSCILRNLSDDYQAKQSTYKLSERKHITKSYQHEYVVYEAQKCIKCGICIQVAGKYKGEIGFAYIGRGFDVSVCFPFNVSIDIALQKASKECAEKCPTGALAFRENFIE
jgi:ferredoxin